MHKANRPHFIVVWEATGFTGKLAADCFLGRYRAWQRDRGGHQAVGRIHRFTAGRLPQP